MFSKKKGANKKKASGSSKSSHKKAAYTTVIGRGISIEGGILKGDGNVRIDGYYVGDITIEGDIEIGVSGAVYGDISAGSAVIAGNCKGNIKAAGSLHLASSAVVEGILESKAIIIDENAVFNGSCKMESHVQLPSKDAVAALPK